MDESLLNKTALETSVEAEMEAMLAEMRRLNTQIEAGQRRIGELKKESQRLNSRAKALLAEIQATF